MNAIDFERRGYITFSPAKVSGPVREELQDRFGAEVLEGLRLDYDPENLRRIGEEEPPTPVLCVARDESTHYAVFRSEEDVDRSRFELTGKAFGVVPDPSLFLKNLRELEDIASITDPDESDDVMDEVLRSIRASHAAYGESG